MMFDYFRGRLSVQIGTAAGCAFLFGVLFIGCQAKQEPVVAETKKFRPVDDSAPAGAKEAAEPAPRENEVAGFSGRNINSSPPNPTSRATPSSEVQGETPKFSSAGQEAASPGPTALKISAELQPILEQLDRMSRQAPKGNTEREQLEDLVRIHTQRLSLAKKALGMKPEPELRRRVVMAMYEILQTFVSLRVPSAMAQFNEFAATMSADPDAEVARIGRHASFMAAFARITTQQLDDGKEIVTEAKKLVEAERGKLNEATLQLLVDVSNNLGQSGLTSDSAAILDLMADAMQGDPKFGEQAAQIALEARMRRMDLDSLLNNVVREQPDAEAKMQEAIKTLLTELKPSRELLSRTERVAHILEATGHFQGAQACYDQIAAAFRDVSDPALAESVKELASKAQTRMGLVGKPLTVEGVMTDGSPFDWSAYVGKVILLDFWATWCGPCLEEMPNIRQNFEQYHAKGFEVVGVNVDTNLADLRQFLTLQSLPWVTVTSQVVLDGKIPDGDFTKIPMAAKCGVQAIPFVVLVGKDGNVDSIHVRGPKLRKRLAELLGEPLTTEIPADPVQPGGRTGTGKQSRSRPAGVVTPIGLLVTQSLWAAEPPTEEKEPNPYLAKPGLMPTELAAYIERMLDRPKAIQTRAGFANAIVDACDRILAESSASDAEKLTATTTKLAMLHREACDGKEAFDKRLMDFVLELKDDSRPAVAREVTFFKLERRVLEAKELPLETIPDLLKEVQEYAAKEKLGAKHLRLASGTVAAINRLENGDEREAQFAVFGKLFAGSGDQELARYGKKLARKPKSAAAEEDR